MKDDITKSGEVENTAKAKPSGGLYARIKMPLKTANIIVAVIIAALVIVTVFLVKNGGFTVDFDTDGGSQVPSVKVMYSEKADPETTPVKEGYTFTGWYTDRECTQSWDVDSDTVTGSMTLYAGWEEK